MAVGRLAAVTLDCSEIAPLVAFYREAAGLEPVHESESGAFLRNGDGVAVALQRVENYRRPEWPGQTVPQQLHLDLAVDDIETAETELLRLGATKPADQPGDAKWRVFLDPAGHPFCASVWD
ncbi:MULTISPECIES: VOC family protein [Micromonospora]|jgi:catechol-2,3-dioxygenase|uniref:VOC family protein n=2 Tax=Micromonospora TaxID=1873 RepID=A0A6N9XQL0_9ACTN|nr:MULTISPECIES: VOC family protein [Micromonospora]AXH93289.1 VOC family protein [Micromonospora aurantiaca]AYF27040.1 glyoxalase [Micromonospora tulbaghiae]MCO1613313.1 VOC family protein [Micromonospora sp. CPM1]NED51545.1 VOC family protein [Micromonospora aurantiaca]RLQ04787.1 VOC family protein [Micromonospora sp. BL1]